VLQHELDHLNGKVFIDRLPWIRRGLVMARIAVRGGAGA